MRAVGLSPPCTAVLLPAAPEPQHMVQWFDKRDGARVTMSFSVFEIVMLACFGVSWPINIYKSIKSQSNKGKSVYFLFAILLGYIAGIIHKLLYSRDIVMALYVLNALMVCVDIVLFYRNKKRELQSSGAD